MRTLARSSLVILSFVALVTPGRAQEVERHPFSFNPSLPLSEAVRVGSMVVLSGMIGLVPGTEFQLALGGIEAETRQTMENIKAALERYGSSLDRVVKCTIMLADMDDWEAMNRVYAPYFAGDLPARTAFGGIDLVLDARVEIECWAMVEE